MDAIDIRTRAIRKQRDYLDMRRPNLGHEEYIRTATLISKTDEDFVDLLENTFSHHEISDFRHSPLSSLDFTKKAHISKLFHENYYHPIPLKQGVNSENPSIDQKTFLEKICIDHEGADENNIMFLVGGVGVGKTTYLCNFIYKNWNAFLHNKTIPIRINIDIELGHEILTLADILTAIKSVILNSIEENDILTVTDVADLSSLAKVTSNANIQDVERSLAHLVKLIRERHGYNICLIIDNIDFLYHLGDRGFFAETLHEQQSNAYQAILALINVFWGQRQYLCSSLGMTVLYAVRNDTLDYVRSKRHDVPLRGMDGRIYSVSEIEKSVGLEIIESRFELIKAMCESYAESAKKAEFLKQLERLSNSYRSPRRTGEALLDNLWQLSRRGLRDLIEQLGNYCWLEFRDGNRSALNIRFSQQYAPSMIAYVCNGRRRYNQFSGNVPNLYLINAPANSAEVAVPSEFKEEHLFTLWLKRAILTFIKSREGHTSVEMIVRMFCGQNGGAYPENLVRYVLGSLTEVPAAELVQVDVGAEGDGGAKAYVKDLSLTDRGRFLLDEFVDSFLYMQIVVDDWRFRIPKKLFDEFRYLEPDYSYLVAGDHEYAQFVAKILPSKGRQAIAFSILVEEALRYEMAVWPKVFERLTREGVEFPSTGDIVSGVKFEIKNIATSIGLIENVRSLIDGSLENELRKSTRLAMNELLMPCLEMNESLFRGR